MFFRVRGRYHERSECPRGHFNLNLSNSLSRWVLDSCLRLYASTEIPKPLLPYQKKKMEASIRCHSNAARRTKSRARDLHPPRAGRFSLATPTTAGSSTLKPA